MTMETPIYMMYDVCIFGTETHGVIYLFHYPYSVPNNTFHDVYYIYVLIDIRLSLLSIDIITMCIYIYCL